MDDKLKWFRRARLGMFIHLGLYSIPGKGEWIMRNELIPHEEYAGLAAQFRPEPGAVSALVRRAKKAGMNYAVFTTRHHDGFCLYDSRVSDFTSVKRGAGYDYVREYVEACRANDMRIGLYYSLGDWRFGFPQVPGLEGTPKQGEQMRKQAHDQVRELLSNYGKIDMLWYDGGWVYPSRPSDTQKEVAEFWQAEKLNAMARKLQPDILINNRSGLPEDFGTCEGHITPENRAWESCVTMGSEHGWGYLNYDPARKTPAQIIEMLATATAKGGNFLLNIGPMANGRLSAAESRLLSKVAKWLKTHGEAIYDAEPESIANPCLGIGACANNHAYFHILRWPGESFILTNVKQKVRKTTLLKTGTRLKFTPLANNRLLLENLPKAPPDPYGNVIKLEYYNSGGLHEDKEK